jgi:alkanesulfonate monooxygenase SsuD/methylene tetrahydromethanopterin reductase-like flavin-dependent oxidoreductase (luciferase family)
MGPLLFLSAGLGVCEALSDPVRAQAVIDLADAAGIDLLVLGEEGAAAPAPDFDPLVVASWLAPRAGGVGLVPLVPTLACEPFHVARALSALDFLTDGRSGWLPTTGAYDPARLGASPSVAPDQQVPKARDFVAATCSLWDSWDADALIIDAASGVYLDPGKVRQSAYRGPYYQVLGPLNAARPPQGHPILMQSDQDPLWRVTPADVLITDLGTGEQGPAPPAGTCRACRVRGVSWSTEQLDELELAFRAGRFSGLHLVLEDPLAELALFAATLLPALERRRLRAGGERCGTLRARLGLPIP